MAVSMLTWALPDLVWVTYRRLGARCREADTDGRAVESRRREQTRDACLTMAEDAGCDMVLLNVPRHHRGDGRKRGWRKVALQEN